MKSIARCWRVGVGGVLSECVGARVGITMRVHCSVSASRSGSGSGSGSVVCVVGADSSRGAAICRALLKEGHDVSAVVDYIDNARNLDELMELQNEGSSIPVSSPRSCGVKHLHSLSIFEVNPLHSLSYQTPFRNCDFVICTALPEHTVKQKGCNKWQNGSVMTTIVQNIFYSIQTVKTVQKIIFCHNHPNKSQHFFSEALREVFNAEDCQFGVDVVVVAQALEQTGSSKEIFEIHDMKAIGELKHRLSSVDSNTTAANIEHRDSSIEDYILGIIKKNCNH